MNAIVPDSSSHYVFVSTTLQTMPYQLFVEKLFKVDSEEMELAHMAMGISGEAGEFCDAIKKHIIYGKPLDRNNIVEELGDLRFYMQAVMNHYGITEDELLMANVRKLEKRYPKGGYSNEDAIARADKVGEENESQ